MKLTGETCRKLNAAATEHLSSINPLFTVGSPRFYFIEPVHAGMRPMQDAKIEIEDIEYVADMLKAIVWIKGELPRVSSQSLHDLEQSLLIAEAALRRVASEMKHPA